MIFPEGNPGAVPLTPGNPISDFRLAYGDITSTPYDPDEPGYRNFTELSDAEIEGFLAAGGSVYRAIGFYYVQLAGKAALVGRSVKDHDLAIDSRQRSADLRALADYWFGLADDEDGASEDAFVIVPTGTQGDFIPEGVPAVYGRQYGIGVWRNGL